MVTLAPELRAQGQGQTPSGRSKDILGSSLPERISVSSDFDPQVSPRILTRVPGVCQCPPGSGTPEGRGPERQAALREGAAVLRPGWAALTLRLRLSGGCPPEGQVPWLLWPVEAGSMDFRKLGKKEPCSAVRPLTSVSGSQDGESLSERLEPGMSSGCPGHTPGRDPVMVARLPSVDSASGGEGCPLRGPPLAP